ncbi:NADP-dependent oxidoreductase [Prosthecobacter sp.]|uniref:NADP-dependent oxidoreductase n=1 Tax=Prosthecobacter sp. TaxID=1965333 RepID=UPI003782E064
MKAAYLTRQAGAEALELGTLAKPSPKAGEALVKVHATAITPSELDWYPTFHLASGAARPFPIVLGHEFSGVIESLGADVSDFQAGDEVYGLNDWFTNGAQAEYVVASATMIARKPASLDHAHASAVPISALTAWQALFEKASLQRGDRVLIHGAAGGVGHFAVQMAKGLGAHVVATASGANAPFVRSLGADEVIDSRSTPFEELTGGIDVVFDTVGGETLERSWRVLRSGGRLVTIAASSAGSSDPRVHSAFLLVRADGAQLAEIGRRLDARELHVHIAGTCPLEHVHHAWLAATSGARHGKTVLRII